MKPTSPKPDEQKQSRQELERKNQEQIDTSLTGGDDEAGRPAPTEGDKRRWPGRRDVT